MRRHQAQKKYTLVYDAVVRVQSVTRMIVARKMCQPRLRAINAAASIADTSVVCDCSFADVHVECACVCLRVRRCACAGGVARDRR